VNSFQHTLYPGRWRHKTNSGYDRCGRKILRSWLNPTTDWRLTSFKTSR